jgi:plasmid stability protein
VRNVPDETIDAYKQKARLNDRSLEQEIRDLLERHRPYTPEERARMLGEIRKLTRPGPTLSLDEIRDGLE